jgi:hypothetical protein
MAEEKASEKIRRLEPEILKYISREVYDSLMELLEKGEEKYSKEAGKCSEWMVHYGVSTIRDVDRLGDFVYDSCVGKALRGEASFEECSTIHSKIFHTAQENIRRMIEDLKKCGARLE